MLSWTSLVVNVLMLLGKSIASYLSGSLSIISTLIDSVMDITSGTVVLEPLTILIVSVIMVMANLFMIGESMISIIDNTVGVMMNIETISIIAFGTLLKLILYVACRRHPSPNTRILAFDQCSDIITNAVAIVAAYVSSKYWLYADPLGAFVICSLIAFGWVKNARQQIPLLIGKTAKPEYMNRITKIAIEHDERIKFIDTLYVYHLGSKFLVELHVVMDRDLSLQQAHDISEPLQLKLERLPYVERAFVHCDYNFDPAEHI
ncbi:unnamed protein product [Anisakis simplex]|uniref:Uncharacterized protein n=1 Tax=Anisakis simplex TaxID=6269 RepID=A0A3P6QF26_ANISI|nr:unnamed protein product [Anisakis simplex]